MIEDEREELELLKLASEKGKFAISILANLSQAQQDALERLQLREWIRLIDVTPISEGRTVRTFRVFMLTKPALEFLRNKSN